MRDLTGKELTENEVTELIRSACAYKAKLWRIPAGVYRVSDRAGTRYIRVADKGYPDLSGYRLKDGKAVFIEVKKESGRMSQEQKDYAKFLNNHNVLYGVARSPEDALLIIDGKWNPKWNEKGRR